MPMCRWSVDCHMPNLHECLSASIRSEFGNLCWTMNESGKVSRTFLVSSSGETLIILPRLNCRWWSREIVRSFGS
jgi:hypothetical protein